VERRSGNLTTPITRFFGRAAEVSQGIRLLSEERLVTMTGPGGVGKSRLALRVAERLRRRFPDGIWHVELSLVREPAELPSALTALGLPPGLPGSSGASGASYGDVAAGVARSLQGRRVLVVLDTCEHLAEAAAGLAAGLLAAPEVRVLATGRRRLGARGERVLVVPPLPLPDPAGPQATTASVRLFADRARAVDPEFALTDRLLPTVSEICRRLDGLPLAIELAAARLRSLSPGELLARLDDRFTLLSGVSRTALPRHRDLWSAVAWSYELCDTRQRRLWRLLSLFDGSFELPEAKRRAAAESGADALDPAEVETVLGELVDASVVLCHDTVDGARHRLLESYREFGLAKLGRRGGAMQVALPPHGPGAERVVGAFREVLTHREREVAGLIAQGLSNAQIAAHLVIAKRTVDAHVRSILAKGGLVSRAQIAAWVAQRDH
jgi:predicted ATPase